MYDGLESFEGAELALSGVAEGISRIEANFREIEDLLHVLRGGDVAREVPQGAFSETVASAKLATRLAEDRALIESVGLFDPVFYAERYPDVLAAGIDPLDHYVETGH